MVLFCLIAITFICTPVFAQDIISVHVNGLSAIDEQTVLDVIEIKEGDTFSLEEIKNAAENLKRWGVFDKIETTLTPIAGGVTVEFNLHEADVVVAIEIDGNYPYLENKIKKYLNLRPGDVFSQTKLDEQIDRIVKFYEREGVVGTQVFVDQEYLPEWGGTIISFHIKRGHAIRMNSIEVQGNKVFPRGRFISAINPTKHFSERGFSEALRRLKELYKDHGYPKARIKVLKKNVDFDKYKVDLSIEITEGPKVKVDFKGAPHISNRTLKKNITIFEEGSLDQYELQNSCDTLKSFLVERGFPDAQVKYEKLEQKDGSIRVIFNIDKNKEQRIRFLNFEGNEKISSSDISQEMQNKEMASGIPGTYYPESVSQDNEVIAATLSKKGFLDAKVGEWNIEPTKQGYALDIKIPVDEGTQTIVQEISFPGCAAVRPDKLLGKIKTRPGKPLDMPGLEEDKKSMLLYYADNGHPYADVDVDYSLSDDKSLAYVNFKIDEGVKVKIGKVLFVGDVMTSQKAMRGAMDIHEGDLYSYRKIVDSQLSMRRLGPFAAVTIETIGLQEKERVVHLRVKVEEQRPFQLDLGVNYSSYDRFTGSLIFSNINAFGWAKTNTLKLIGGQKTAQAQLLWLDPRFLSSSFEMTTIGWVQYKQRPSYAYTQYGGSMDWLRRLKRFGLMFRYEIDRNHFIKGDSVAANADSLRNNVISRVALSASYDSRDSFSSPTRGFYTLGSAEFYNEIKGSGANFVELGWQGENELTLIKRVVLSTALRFNRIETFGSNVSIPTNELYFLGGDDTIRGFPEDSLGPVNANGRALGSNTRWILNEELRIKLYGPLGFAFFYDMGSLTQNFGDINWYTIRRSFGLGLRYITPVGPVRAEYAFKLDRHPGDSAGRFHFTFGYVF